MSAPWADYPQITQITSGAVGGYFMSSLVSPRTQN